MTEWPVAVWIVLICLVLFLGQYALLYRQWRQGRSDTRQAERRLADAASRLRAYAANNDQRLPGRLQEVGWGPDETIAYRPAPFLTLDERLILLHDARPTRKLLQFPSLRPGRGVVLCSGRVLELTEEAFEKLLDADSRLRQELGLNQIA